MSKICIDSKFGIVLDHLTNERKGRLFSLLFADELPDNEDPLLVACYVLGIETGVIKKVENCKA